jgi:uncharacterized protein YdeI (YjbR/CyaY-like superfamily)
MQGALLKDPKGILVQQTKNVQSARQIRFTNPGDVIKNKTTIKSYIKEAIKNDKAGLKVELKKTTEYEIPEEFQRALGEMPELKFAFFKLTPADNGHTCFISLPQNSPKQEWKELKNIFLKFLTAKAWMTKVRSPCYHNGISATAAEEQVLNNSNSITLYH